MIEVITGAPGAGKSYRAVLQVIESVEAGRPVVTNVALRDGWALAAARRYLGRRVRGRKYCERLARQYQALVYSVPTVPELIRVRLRGRGEERGDIVLDEAHDELNSRTWDSDKRREEYVKFFARHRHYGFRMYVITQRDANIDAQIRGLFEYRTIVRNLRRVKVWGIKIVPFDLFVCVTVWNDKAQSVLARRAYKRSRVVSQLYDTHALAADIPEDVVWHGPVGHQVDESLLDRVGSSS